MSKLRFCDLKEHYNEEVILKGFIDNLRDLQYVQFLVLRDRTGKVQVTIEKNDENKELNELVSSLTLESTVTVTGKLLESPKVKLNGMEVIPSSIVVTSKSENELPINYKDKESALIDTRLDYRFLDLRKENLKCDMCLTNRNLKGQFKESDYNNSKYVIIIGESEVETGVLTIKNNNTKEEYKINKNELVSFIKE